MVSESISSGILTLVTIVVQEETAFSCFGILLDGIAMVASPLPVLKCHCTNIVP